MVDDTHDEQPLIPPPASWADREPSPEELAAYLGMLRDAEVAQLELPGEPPWGMQSDPSETGGSAGQ